MKVRLFVTLVTGAVLAASLPCAGAIDLADSAVEARLKKSVDFLASDKLEGRGPKSDGLDQAAELIAREFKAARLNVGLFNGQPFQTFREFADTEPGEKNHLALQIGTTQQKLEIGKSYTPLSASSSTIFELPLVFAGYGITSVEAKYDDYKDVDVRGKAVVLLRHEPRQKDEKSPFDGRRNSRNAYLSSKIKNAIEHGAAAVVFCSDAVAVEQAGGKDELLRFKINTAEKPSIPVFHFQRLPLETLLATAGKPLLGAIERNIDARLEPQSFAIPNASVKGVSDIKTTRRSLRNVVAELPGRGELAMQTVVVGAHYDHLGRGGSGSLAPWTNDIHNGADDNASGTACLLEIARQLAATKAASRRRVLFIAFSGEELGLLGSEAYVRRPLYDMKDTVAMINLDMVGRIRNERIYAHGVGTSPQFPEQIKTLCEQRELTPLLRSSGYGPSDHASFYGRGVPVIHFFSGFHSDYHRPSDDADKLNLVGMRKIVGVSVDLVNEIAKQKKRPEVRRDELLDELEGLEPDSPFTEGKPYLGVGVRSAEKGLAITNVYDASPAAAAQLRVGDVLQKMDGKVVTTIEELRKVIAAHKTGDKVKALIKRRDIEIEVVVELKSR